METLKNYLNNIFASLPKTEKYTKMKEEIYENMEMRYLELRQYGKSENEAIGIAISEFGDISELTNDSDIKDEKNDKKELQVLNKEQINDFIETNKKIATFVGLGVGAIICGVSLFVGLSNFNSFFDNIGLVIFLIIIAASVGIFVYSNSLKGDYDFIESGEFVINYGLQEQLKNELRAIRKKYTPLIVIGVSLCILSVVPILLNLKYGVSIMLVNIAIAAFLFITSGKNIDSYETLLGKNKECSINKKAEKMIGICSSVVFPLATIIFLINGFLYGNWSTAWIIFPITGILFGIFSSVVNAVYSEK